MIGQAAKTEDRPVNLGCALALTLLATVALFALGGVAVYRSLPDWSSRADFGSMFGAVGAFFSALALVGVVAALVLQRHDLELQRVDLAGTRADIDESKRLSALRFAMDLAPRFERLHADYVSAWVTLQAHSGPNLDTNDPDWDDVVDALELHYRSAQFVYQLAVLVDAGTVDLKTLYLLYYDDLTDHPDGRLLALAEWLGGTGLDLAANYVWEDVLRLARPTARLLEALGDLHVASGCTPYTHQLDSIRDTIGRVQANGDPHG